MGESEADFLKILNSRLILKTFTHVYRQIDYISKIVSFHKVCLNW